MSVAAPCGSPPRRLIPGPESGIILRGTVWKQVVLETLQRYAEADAERATKSARSIRLPLDRRLDHRFFAILSLSIAFHIVFFPGLILLDSWVGHRATVPRRPSDPEQLVKIVDLAPRGDKGPPLRTPPERLERVDLSHLVENPNLGDDTSLVARSPRPGSGPDDLSNKGKSGREPGQPPGPRSSGSSVQQPAGNGQNHAVQPPGARSIEMKPAPAPSEQATAALPGSQPAPAPPPPPQRQNARPRTALDSSGPAGSDESSGRPREIGLSVIESQYRAYVREKIYDQNRRIMPRDWITTVLSNEVSAVFEVVLARDGRVVSMRMLRGCGYANLDRVARDAISLASPFKGYPQSLGDTFTVTVTVHYTPFG
jgi:TonB family protein